VPFRGLTCYLDVVTKVVKVPSSDQPVAAIIARAVQISAEKAQGRGSDRHYARTPSRFAVCSMQQHD
jgi:hypothetical protein